MNKMVCFCALLVLAATLGAPAGSAESSSKKHSPEHVAAIKKCDHDYLEALQAATSLKGKERKEAEEAAKAYRKQCRANAPA